MLQLIRRARIVNGASAWTAEERDSSRRRTRRPEDTHRRDLESLGDSMVTVFSRRDRGQVVALKRLDEHRPEIKSMHTIEAAYSVYMTPPLN